MSDAALDRTAAVTGAADWRDYVALMKPRVMSLVVFTAMTGLAAAPASPHPVIALTIILAIAVGAGASGALNMAYDADIDAVMGRTRMRPVASGRVSAAEANTLGLVLSALSVAMLGLATNLLAAALLAFTIFFYAVVYTMWLKRRTPQNIVIGGLAGALPPGIAWAAATGGLTLDPVLLVAIIFIWTPPHFWALALYKSGDYARAGVPMLPNVKGPAATRRAILIYSLVLAPLGVAPALTGIGGPAYLAVSLLGGAAFIGLALRVARSRAGEAGAVGESDLYAVRAGDRAARDLFAFSILYLFGVFAVLLAEHALPGVPL